MDLSDTRRHITPEEKARRMAEGCSYYCRELGHIVRDCPLGLRVDAAVLTLSVPRVVNTPPSFITATATEQLEN